MHPSPAPCVLQICHGYDGPFLDCARQYAVLFRDSPYRVVTVFLTGPPSEEVRRNCASDEVLFLDHKSRDLRGLKFAIVREVKEIVHRRDACFIIAHRFKPTYIALLASHLPVIGVNHAFGVYARLSRRLFATLYRRRLYLLGVSNAVRDDIRSQLPKWPSERIETLYNRLDVSTAQEGQLERDAARAFLGLPENSWVVGNVGRLHPDKDQATLLRGFALALPRLPEGSLLAIMGSGPLEASLKRLAAELNVAGNVRFLGQVPGARRYFKAFDLFVLSSDHEPFGMVLLEAMAAGIPLLCSDCGGGREVVKAVGGLFPLGDASVLADQLVGNAGLTELQLAEMRVSMSQALSRRFSDEAARKVFWELPFISSLTKNNAPEGRGL